ncbi:MAG: orotate phosphoribosyltransferase [Methanobacterium sp.]|uniref:orotate phosphoribosyltransferase n=1 Tax=Methanobacterium sp. TaxID=2164 RepID=UPI003D65EC76|nr:orotate phosphoribosyltransferase [Methanobacterium sp.]
MKNKKNELIELLKEKEVVKFGKFILSSGKESDYYVNMKMAITNPQILKAIAIIVSSQIIDDNINKVAGPALGAVPIATAVSLESEIPMLMVRKAKKGYGTSQLIEGELKEGDSIIVVEDVTTTGNSLIKAIKALEENGGKVKKAVVVVDRAEGAIENLKNEGIVLEPLISINDFNK